MINVRDLGDQLAQQDHDLRATLQGLITNAAPGDAAAPRHRFVPEGLLAIHERQRTMTLLVAQIP